MSHGVGAPAGRPSLLQDAIHELGRFVADLRWDELSRSTQARAMDVVLDSIGVTIVGAITPELRALQRMMATERGAVRPLGTRLRVPSTIAAWLNGTAICALELDEGNKRARGHPAAHVVPAASAVAGARTIDGANWLAAVVAGYEVAARLGMATQLHPGVHPHGNVGVAGAAATVARLEGGDAATVAAAVDAATALPIASDFEAALDGSFVRNTWIGQANVSGILAARLARAGVVSVDGRAAGTLGGRLGEFDSSVLTSNLGQLFAVNSGYFKRHASCSFTHPPADAALLLMGQGVTPSLIEEIEVRTHRLAAPLKRVHFETRLGAMFSIPYVVAAAFRFGGIDPAATSVDARADPEVRRLASVTRVVHDESFDDNLPLERRARVSVRLKDGSVFVVEVPNPVGDVDHHPFGRAEVVQKLDRLLQPGEAAKIVDVVGRLPRTDDVGVVFDHDLP